MRITALAGGVGGARFVRGLLHHLGQLEPATLAADHPSPEHEITVIGNTGDDITLFGLRVCPDLDTILYTIGGGAHEQQGWGRADETFSVSAELQALGAQPDWFTMGDRDMAAHIRRSQLLGQGLSLSEVTRHLADRWRFADRGLTLLPMTDTPVETHVVLADDPAAGELAGQAVHFQQWWVQHRAALPAERFVVAGLDRATAAPGVLDAIRQADVVLLPPSNPVVSIGIILGVPGVRDALRGSRAPVVGVSPLIGGRPVRGHADACLRTIGVDSTSAAVAQLYADFLDGWLVAEDDPMLAERAPRPTSHPGLVVRGTPLLMSDLDAAATLAGNALALTRELSPKGTRS